MSQEIIDLTQKLLDSIAGGDWETYSQLCDSSLTCFEPEAKGHLVSGMDFHKFYFDNRSVDAPAQTTTISQPHVRMIGDSVAVISYVRLSQKMNQMGPTTDQFEETRVWEKQDGNWQHVHFHRSAPTRGRDMMRKMMMKRWGKGRKC